MRLLDLFCGAGGAAMGYSRAGFTEIVGVDINPQKRYPFEFVQGDALEYVAQHGHKYDLIVAGPPCQLYSVTAGLSKGGYPDLVGPTREALQATGKPYIIENVPGAPLENPLMLCGTMFPELRVRRHRLFECWPAIWFPPGMCYHWGRCGNKNTVNERGKRVNQSFDTSQFITVTGNYFRKRDGAAAMGIDWMTKNELSQAIPPAYTEWLAREMLRLI
jgi:DNA (cytosine-5)-methyltransferase 1